MYQVRLSDFEGPLDLLLFFIQRDELDVYDIPIAQIADEFLDYVRVMDEIDLDGAGEFIYMAALLISIKARMLLPRTNRDGDEEILDPRKELVERLVEYVRFKDAAEQLGDTWEVRSKLFVRDEPVDLADDAISEEDVEYDV
ncbi:MAG: ScpA family protein [Rhodothermia bacterium]